MSPIPFIPTFPSPTAIDTKNIAVIGYFSITVTDETVKDTTASIATYGNDYGVYVDVTAVSDVSSIETLLNEGARVAFVTVEQLALLKDTIDAERFAVVGEAGEKLPCAKVANSKDIESLGKVLNDPFHTYINLSENPTFEEILKVLKKQGTPLVPASLLTRDPKNESQISIGKLIAEGIETDREDGLYTTLVVDEAGIALGLVYSSKESIVETVRTGTGVYQSRKRGLWYKGATSGDTQELVRIDTDCDGDCLRYVVRQKGNGFCHLKTASCFGPYDGLRALEKTLLARKISSPPGSYTSRLFNDEKLLRAKIQEEAEELCDATTKEEIAFEAADVIYFTLTRCIAAGVSLADVEKNLDKKARKVKRRKGDAKGKFAKKEGIVVEKEEKKAPAPTPAPVTPKVEEEEGRITMKRFNAAAATPKELEDVLRRPAQKNKDINGIVVPIVEAVKTRGDAALLEYAAKFDRATLTSPVINAPFAPELMNIDAETKEAIDISFENIRKFHAAQGDNERLRVETMPGVICSRFVRPIERVGLYVPGGTAVLPSTTMMLGVPALVAGCKTIVIASPPRSDGSISPEIVYIAHRVGASAILLAGGAQAVAALAYGTESCPKVDKILGPGNQFVTAAKMLVSNDTGAGVSIDMPAGPSEVLVIADKTANPAFVASDLLSQAEHGVDSQVILITVGLEEQQIQDIEDQVHEQAMVLPRVKIVRGSIAHSVTLQTKTIEEAMVLSNIYAPEHLILHVEDAEKVEELVDNAGSVFVGQWTPESVGDYSAGVNHSLPTYGYAKQYSGVNLASFQKHITSSNLSAEGIKNVGNAVMRLAKVEELEAHRRAVEIRLEYLAKTA